LEVKLFKDVVLFDVGQDQGKGTLVALRLENGATGRDQVFPGTGELSVGAFKVVTAESNLFEVVTALHSCRRLTYLLYRWKQQPDEYGDDGDDHQQLDQGESVPRSIRHAKISSLWSGDTNTIPNRFPFVK
jgi:hypothetical protein